ncbi:unnamed protein product [Boreogadus saida]
MNRDMEEKGIVLPGAELPDCRRATRARASGLPMSKPFGRQYTPGAELLPKFSGCSDWRQSGSSGGGAAVRQRKGLYSRS